eukprot:comp21342_c0_seq1/m.45913 comp21342_c0_seq1/g.45913  ORF comp21342_c0_seq1/g.45913 comp21342_c0_seq1/m.45913 type:complete len:417 (-) comp21342_c0_seq1:78-1328(-)
MSRVLFAVCVFVVLGLGVLNVQASPATEEIASWEFPEVMDSTEVADAIDDVLLSFDEDDESSSNDSEDSDDDEEEDQESENLDDQASFLDTSKPSRRGAARQARQLAREKRARAAMLRLKAKDLREHAKFRKMTWAVARKDPSFEQAIRRRTREVVTKYLRWFRDNYLIAHRKAANIKRRKPKSKKKKTKKARKGKKKARKAKKARKVKRGKAPRGGLLKRKSKTAYPDLSFGDPIRDLIERKKLVDPIRTRQRFGLGPRTEAFSRTLPTSKMAAPAPTAELPSIRNVYARGNFNSLLRSRWTESKEVKPSNMYSLGRQRVPVDRLGTDGRPIDIKMRPGGPDTAPLTPEYLSTSSSSSSSPIAPLSSDSDLTAPFVAPISPADALSDGNEMVAPDREDAQAPGAPADEPVNINKM